MLDAIVRFFFRSERIRSGERSKTVKQRSSRIFLEILERRDAPAVFQPDYILSHGGASEPFATSGPTGLTPTQVRHAYGFDQISFNGVAGNGAGTTIAIVDAYDDPNIASDLHQFDLRFGLADPVFTKVNEHGGASMPAADAGWSSEIALDVEWAHAIAPAAKILLVEASSANDSDLFTAVRYAASQTGVVAVSMSWGGGEYSGESSLDSAFKTPAGHSGVTFVASSGDQGAPASYPAASPNVLSVGGTTMWVDSAGNILSESAWSGSGGGISTVESAPSFQKSLVTSLTRRGTPDVAYDADPNTGFPVYDSYNNGTSAPWSQFGGTSDAAPQWAALVAIADQGRAAAGLSSLDGATQTLPQIYAMPAADFHDITSGSSTGSPSISATVGYDLATGRGTPYANRVVAALVGTTSVATASGLTVTSATTTTAGNSLVVTVKAVDSTGKAFAAYRGTVQLSSSDGAAGLPASYTFTAADQGAHTFTITLKTAGSQSIIAADSLSLSGSETVTVTPAAASKLAFSQQPANGSINSPLSAVTVSVFDAFGNRATTDNSDVVTISLGSNPGNATLSGSLTATVSGGVATFANLTINTAATGYTMVVTAGQLTSATSSSFNIYATPAANGKVIEDFESSRMWNIVGGFGISAVRATYAAHDGGRGLDDYAGNDWIYRSDAAAQVKAGDTLSVWLGFAGAADGRAYFSFGNTAYGALSLVAAPNTGQLILQDNTGYGFINLAAVSQTFSANHWYRLEVDWSTSGAIVGKLFDGDGVTLLNSVSATSTTITAGGFGFRATGSDKYWDTVTLSQGVNSFAWPATAGASVVSSQGGGGSTQSPGYSLPPMFFVRYRSPWWLIDGF